MLAEFHPELLKVLANSLLLLAFLVDSQNTAEVNFKSVVLHIIANTNASQRASHHLVRESNKRAHDFILLEVFCLEVVDEIVELLAE